MYRPHLRRAQYDTAKIKSEKEVAVNILKNEAAREARLRHHAGRRHSGQDSATIEVIASFTTTDGTVIDHELLMFDLLSRCRKEALDRDSHYLQRERFRAVR